MPNHRWRQHKIENSGCAFYGKAIVANEIACEGIHVEDGKNVIFAESVDEYVDAIKLLIENKDLRSNMGSAASKLIEEEYAYEMVGKKLSSSYQQCLEPMLTKVNAAQGN